MVTENEPKSHLIRIVCKTFNKKVWDKIVVNDRKNEDGSSPLERLF